MSFDIFRLKEIYEYKPETGDFIQKVRMSMRVKAGDVAGAKSKAGYIYLSIDGRRYLAHRLAWAYVYGEMPNMSIDHINRNKSDNRIENLRIATSIQNSWNRNETKRSSSGFKGVFWDGHTNKWIARICINGKHKNLGRFQAKEDARDAYVAFAKNAHGEFFCSEVAA